MSNFIRCAALAALLASTLGAAPGVSAPTAPADAPTIIARMIARNPSLASFRVRVHVDTHTNVPFVNPKLDGTAYFKRPNNYEVVFDRVPSYAKGFEKLVNDVGDPLAWEKDNVIVLEGKAQVDGKTYLVLRLTKKIRSDILAYALAYVDAETYELPRMEWHYVNGRTNVMTQTYREEGTYSVIATQHATLDTQYVKATADATYGNYQTNVAVDDTVFKSK